MTKMMNSGHYYRNGDSQISPRSLMLKFLTSAVAAANIAVWLDRLEIKEWINVWQNLKN